VGSFYVRHNVTDLRVVPQKIDVSSVAHLTELLCTNAEARGRHSAGKIKLCPVSGIRLSMWSWDPDEESRSEPTQEECLTLRDMKNKEKD
jgi:hypothetical protein